MQATDGSFLSKIGNQSAVAKKAKNANICISKYFKRIRQKDFGPKYYLSETAGLFDFHSKLHLSTFITNAHFFLTYEDPRSKGV